jgi:uncharacterized membrane protein SpoIIM required for sporulation
MDIDAYTAAHRDEWERLAQLGKQRHHTGAEADELIDRYQAGATQLSAIRSSAGQTLQGDRLSLYLSRARMRFASAPANVLQRLPEFFVWALPAALYRIRWLCLAVTLACAAVAALYFVWVASDPRILATMGSQADLENYANEQFINYYSEFGEFSFGATVWSNNALIAVQCIAGGILGFYPLMVLYSNASAVGEIAAVLHAHGRLDDFFLYISPHGQLELYSIFVAGAAGLAIFWSWIAPGSRTRLDSLAAGGRSLMTVAVGLILSLLVSGVIEGFVTRQPWPWPVKIGIGTLALLGFLAYQWILGRRAFRAGQTGDLDEFEAGARRLAAG